MFSQNVAYYKECENNAAYQLFSCINRKLLDNSQLSNQNSQIVEDSLRRTWEENEST